MRSTIHHSRVFRTGILPLAVLIMAGCEEDEPTVPTQLTVAAPAQARAGTMRPWEGSYVSAAPGVLIAPGDPDAEERCTARGLFTLRGVTEGHATHVGRFTAVSSNCTAFPIPGPVEIIDGRIVITAANGDQILSTYSGRQEAVDLGTGSAAFEVSNRIVGGTGRFADASGEDTNLGTINFQTGQLAGGFRGWISY